LLKQSYPSNHASNCPCRRQATLPTRRCFNSAFITKCAATKVAKSGWKYKDKNVYWYWL